MKHWLKITSVEWGNVTKAAREDFKSVTKACQQIVRAARAMGADQPIEVREELHAFNDNQLLPRELFESLTLASYSNEYAFRLLHEWPGAAAFTIQQTKVLATNSETGVEEDRREEAITICAVVWTEQGLLDAAQWWLADCYNPDHLPQGVEEPVQQLAKAASLAPEAVPDETKAKVFAAGLTAWISEYHADVNSAALPLLLKMEPHYLWNAHLFNSQKSVWLTQLEVGFSWALIGDAAIHEAFSLPDGSEYEGEHVNGKPHGRGCTVAADGTRFSGFFRYGKRHGQGTLSWPAGARYIGRWWRGVSIGKRVYVEEDGTVLNVPNRKGWTIAKDITWSLLDAISDKALRRLIGGLLCTVLAAPIAYTIREAIVEREEAEQAWLGWITHCDLSPDNSASVASFLAETEFSPETLVFQFDDYAELLQAMRSTPNDRLGYLMERLGLAMEFTDLNPSQSVAARCARKVDSAMIDYEDYLNQIAEDVGLQDAFDELRE